MQKIIKKNIQRKVVKVGFLEVVKVIRVIKVIKVGR